MDVAWKVGTGSEANDWELRMSMRSFWKNYQTCARFWIVGHIPSWVDPALVGCLPWPDPYRRCKDANLIHKALRLSLEPDVSDMFVFCSDDQILIKPSSTEDFKIWHCGEIPKEVTEDSGKWQRRLINTGIQLRNAGYSALHYDCHIPCPLRKEWIKEALRFDFSKKPGMCVHSTILNCCEPEAFELTGTVRAWLITDNITEQKLDDKLLKNRFASMNAKSPRYPSVIAKVEQLFPDPAPWELDRNDDCKNLPSQLLGTLRIH